MAQPLDSVEWAAMYVYYAQIENFKSRDLTDEEAVVMEWMQKIANDLKERSK